MKTIIWLLTILLFVGSVSAFDWAAWEAARDAAKNPALAKEVLTISDCYNISLRVKQISGNTSAPTFKDCTDKGEGEWYCDCHNTIGDYSLMILTDKTELSKSRIYTISMTYYTYELSKSTNKFELKDWGDRIDTGTQDLTNLGRNEIIIEKPIYINNTVYQEKIVNVPVYQDRIVNVPTYIENTTRLEELNNTLQTELADTEKRRSDLMTWTIIFGVTTAGLLIFIIRSYIKEMGE